MTQQTPQTRDPGAVAWSSRTTLPPSGTGRFSGTVQRLFVHACVATRVLQHPLPKTGSLCETGINEDTGSVRPSSRCPYPI